jgi:hypothetical protein
MISQLGVFHARRSPRFYDDFRGAQEAPELIDHCALDLTGRNAADRTCFATVL